MPISLEQPQPLAPGIAAAYGATAQLSHDLPAMAAIYQRNAAMEQAAQQHAQSLQAQVIGQQSQVGERRLEMQQHGMDQAAQFATSRLPSERDVFAANAEIAQQNVRAQNAAWLSQQHLSQQEEMDLRRRQDAIGWVSQQLSTGQMTQEQADGWIGKLRTGIDRDKMRQERASAEMMETKKKQLMDQAAFLAAVTSEDAAVRAKAIKSREVMQVSPHTGEMEPFVIDEHGLPHPYKFTVPQKDAAGTMQQKADADLRKAEFAEVKAAAVEYGKILEKAREHVAKRAAARDKDGKYLEPDLQRIQGEGGYNDTLLGVAKREAGGAANEREFVERRRALHRETVGNPGAGGAAAPSAGNAAAPPGQPAKPFDVTKPETQSDDQKGRIRELNEFKADINRHFQMPHLRDEYTKDADEAMRLLGQYGSKANMPEFARKHYEAVVVKLGSIPNPETPKGREEGDSLPGAAYLIKPPVRGMSADRIRAEWSHMTTQTDLLVNRGARGGRADESFNQAYQKLIEAENAYLDNFEVPREAARLALNRGNVPKLKR